MNQSYRRFAPLDKPQYKIHTGIAEPQGTVLAPYARSYRLWAFLRGLDVNGSGCVKVGLEAICESLQVKPSTVYEWLRSGLGVWFQYSENLGGNLFYIRYRSLTRICCECQINDLGAIAFVDLKHLSRGGVKATVAELVANLLQHHAYYSAREKVDRSERYKITQPSSIPVPASELLAGAKGQRFTRIAPDANVIPHTTIRNISSSIGRHCRTFQNRMSNSWRESKGLDPIDRTQILRRFSEQETVAYMRCCDVTGKRTRRAENPRSPNECQAVLNYGGGLYWAGGNVYGATLDLKSSRFERTRIKKAESRTNRLA